MNDDGNPRDCRTPHPPTAPKEWDPTQVALGTCLKGYTPANLYPAICFRKSIIQLMFSTHCCFKHLFPILHLVIRSIAIVPRLLVVCMECWKVYLLNRIFSSYFVQYLISCMKLSMSMRLFPQGHRDCLPSGLGLDLMHTSHFPCVMQRESILPDYRIDDPAIKL